eukprot:23653_1
MRTGASVICVFCVFCVTSVKLLSFSNNQSSPSLRMCRCDLFICCILPLKGSSFTIVGCRMRFGVFRSSLWLQFIVREMREIHRDVFDGYALTIQLIINSLRHTRRLLRLITTTAFLHRSKQLIHCDLSCH